MGNNVGESPEGFLMVGKVAVYVELLWVYPRHLPSLPRGTAAALGLLGADSADGRDCPQRTEAVLAQLGRR